MRIVRYIHEGSVGWGLAGKDSIVPLREHPFVRILRSGESIPFSRVRLLAPSVPSKIILVGLNYRRHAAEMGMPVPSEPVIFLKPPTSLASPNDPIVYPRGVTRLDYEAELALVIRSRCRNVSPRSAAGCILGYTCLNDVTARDLQKKDGQWTRAKSFDSFCPCGPWVETKFDARHARVRAFLNGRCVQDSSTADFIFTPARIVSFVSSIMTLYPGDIISTGTPEGVGPMRPGDRIRVDIEGIGSLENTVVSSQRMYAC